MLGTRDTVVGALLGVFVGCAPVYVRETATETALSSTLGHEGVAGSTRYSASASVDGEQISVVVDQEDRCVDSTTPRSHRVTSVTRTSDPAVTRTTWAIAAVATGLGIYSYSNADSLAAQSSAMTNPDAYREGGAGLAIIGIAAVAVAIADAARSTDYERDDGVILGQTRRVELACEQRKSTNEPVVLLLPKSHSVSGRLDALGNVAFALMDIPAAGLPDEREPLTVMIGKARIDVRLALSQVAEIRSALLSNPRSRVASDALGLRRSQCSAAVSNAREATPEGDLAEGARSVWQAAHDACGDLWTADLEQERSAVDRRLADAKCNQHLAVIGTGLASEDDQTLAEVPEAIAIVRAKCASDAFTGKLRTLETTLARVTKRRALEARRVALVQARAAEQRQSFQEVRQRSWGSAMLLCNDGTLSPSCTCGRDSYRGCCSHHHGVDRCSAGDP